MTARSRPKTASQSPGPDEGGKQPAVLLIMGVSGAGKTTVGRLLAAELRCPFVDGDRLHTHAAIAKMQAGVPLTDADRDPWLTLVRDQLRGWQDQGLSGVLACSALKRSYRDRIFDGCPSARLIYLQGPRALIGQRLRARRHHFMPQELLPSQFADLQEPAPEEQAIVVSVTTDPESIAKSIVQRLDAPSPKPVGGFVLQHHGDA